jgi:hypothetical protein
MVAVRLLVAFFGGGWCIGSGCFVLWLFCHEINSYLLAVVVNFMAKQPQNKATATNAPTTTEEGDQQADSDHYGYADNQGGE